MVIIQPFEYEKTTAFKERVQIANKVNEIIDLFNELDIESKINIFNEEIEIINGKIAEIDSKIIEVDNAVATVEGYNNRLVAVENKNVEQDSKITTNTNNIGVHTERLDNLDVKTTNTDNRSLANQTEINNIKRGNYQFESGKKSFLTNTTLEILGIYSNKCVPCVSDSRTWVRAYYTTKTNLANQIITLVLNGQKGNNKLCTGILSCYLNGSTLELIGIGNISSDNKSRICAVRKVEGNYEIWCSITDGNTGIVLSRISELNWGNPTNHFMPDGVTKDATFDYTDTTKYVAYGLVL